MLKKTVDCPVCKETWEKSQRDWIVCRIYIVCRFIVDIYNMWFEIIHIKNRLH